MAHAQCVRPLFDFKGEAPREDTGGEPQLISRARVTLDHLDTVNKVTSATVIMTQGFSVIKPPLRPAFHGIILIGHLRPPDCVLDRITH